MGNKDITAIIMQYTLGPRNSSTGIIKIFKILIKIIIGNDKSGKMKKKMIPEYNAKYSLEELVLFSNDKDKNIMKLNSDLK